MLNDKKVKTLAKKELALVRLDNGLGVQPPNNQYYLVIDFIIKIDYINHSMLYTTTCANDSIYYHSAFRLFTKYYYKEFEF